MQAAPKQTESAAAAAEAPVPEAAAPTPVTAAHGSPARALQARLARELGPARNSWMGHSAGLVLVAMFSVWIAAILLHTGI
ncbi:MAG: hypothetical protein ACK4HR_05685 [Hyphomonas sp.]|jgi:hypothetical protein